MTASHDARQAMTERVGGAMAVAALAAVMPDGRTIGQWLDEAAEAREHLIDVSMVPCVHGSATHCGADPDRDLEDYCGGCLASELLPEAQP